jgi:hypothetical protein
MKSILIAIAIGVALILGIVLIGGIRITRASELSNKTLTSRVLLVDHVNSVDRDLQKELVTRDLNALDRSDLLLSSRLDREDLNRVDLLNGVVGTLTVGRTFKVGVPEKLL